MIKHETLFRKDNKYNFVLPIKYNKKIFREKEAVFLFI